MGRGRAKAKQTKVARDLKYRTVDTDFASLERELRNSESSAASSGFYDEPDYNGLAEVYGSQSADVVDDDEDDPR
ncbi:DUF3073 domain-containing protein [Tessaracoccus sp. SD287]|uniref:DUF3073 domain-containing protein n=1 Tax=Tessaracoccus sp. SD287 TaxID=2782008 RepID=UPI001A965FA4|nr:DUF3073 domain-containing protein [Tessaracoccus sp. SD287]MBO1030782.1 DUF3073 domain-containing protein [Tessaracoccus sp. SD287]